MQCDHASDATWRPNLETMQVAPPDDQILNKWKWCYLVPQFSTDAGGTTKIATNANTATWWLNLQSMQVAISGGQVSVVAQRTQART